MPDLLIAIVLVVVVLGIIMLIAVRDPKPNKKRFGKGIAGALGAFNEFYNPSAQKAAVIVEEKSRERKQSGNSDKKNPRQN